MADVQTDPPGSLECVRDPDFGPSQDERTGLEVESSEEKFSAEGGGLATTEAARSDEATGLDGGSTDASPSPQEQYADGKTKVGKGLESVGNLTADAFQRIASAVGDVAKAPAVVMANVGGQLGSNANSPTSSRGTSLVERVSHLEMQMTMLEEKYNSKTLASEFNLSPRSYPTTPRSTEKLRSARSLLQETEKRGTLVERVQILEDRITEHMESIEKALSSIQSKLAHIDTMKFKPESMAVQDSDELQESPSGEEFHDADQGSGNLESLEPLEQKSFEEAGVGSGETDEASGTSSLPQEALAVKEPLVGAPTAESTLEFAADKSGTVLPSTEPQLASSVLEEPQYALAKQPSAAEPCAQFPESAEDVAEKSTIAVPAAEDSTLTSVEENPQETPVKESLAAAPTVEPAEPIQGTDAGKSGTVFSSSEPQSASKEEEPQSASKVEKPQETLAKEPLMTEASAKLEEPAQVNAVDKTGTLLAPAESPSTSTAEEPQDGRVGAVQEDKHVQKEANYKSAEDVKVPAAKPEASYVMEPKPHGENQEKKGKRHDGVAEEEKKSRQPFKHLRDRFRRAFRSNKGS